MADPSVPIMYLFIFAGLLIAAYVTGSLMTGYSYRGAQRERQDLREDRRQLQEDNRRLSDELLELKKEVIELKFQLQSALDQINDYSAELEQARQKLAETLRQAQDEALRQAPRGPQEGPQDKM